jgi:HEAT repeat protein
VETASDIPVGGSESHRDSSAGTGDPQGGLGVFTTDASLRVQTWNPWLEEASGIPAAGARGRLLSELLPDLDERGLLAAYERVLAEGAIEVLAPALHGYLIPCPPPAGVAGFDRMHQRATIGPLRDEDRIVGTITAVEDVTARLASERELAAKLAHVDPTVRREAAATLAGAEPLGADPLLAAIGDEDWRVRRAAVAALRQRSTSEVVQYVLEALRDRHGDFSVLSSAIGLLAAADVDVVAPLAELLRHGSPDLRLQAALVLGERGDPRGTAPLMEALDSADENLRFHAIEALGKLRAADAVERLIEIAESQDFFVAFPALEALACIGAPGVAPRIAPLVRNELLRGTVVDVLGRIGDEDVVGPLTQLLNESAAPTDVIAGALARVHSRYEERYRAGEQIADLVRRTIAPAGTRNLLDAVQDGRAASLEPVTRVLGWLEGPAVERALTRLLGHPAVRSKAVEYFVRQGPRMVDLLIEQLRAEDLETRHAAITGLGRIGDRQATPALVHVLAADPPLAVAAAGALGRIGDEAAFDALMARVDDEDPAVRQAVIAALNSIGHPAMSARVKPLLRDSRPHVRESAVRIAGYFGYPDCADDLLACCADPDPRVQCAALEHLVYFEDARVVPAVLNALAGASNPQARASAAQALARLDTRDARAIPPLVTALADPHPWVRYFAARALGAQGAQDAVDALTGLAFDDPAGHVRISAIDALGSIASERAVPALAALAQIEGDDETERSKAAIQALGAIGGEAVWDPLRAALRSEHDERRASAVEALGKLGGPEAIDLLQWAAAADAAPVVVAAAVRGLGSLAADGAGAAARSLVELAADAAHRELVIEAIASLPPTAVEPVGAGLQDPRPNVRLALVHALARMRHADASRQLKAAMADPSAEVRLAAITELRRLGALGLDRKLLELARADGDPLVRRAALAALGGHAGGVHGGDSEETQGT